MCTYQLLKVVFRQVTLDVFWEVVIDGYNNARNSILVLPIIQSILVTYNEHDALNVLTLSMWRYKFAEDPICRI